MSDLPINMSLQNTCKGYFQQTACQCADLSSISCKEHMLQTVKHSFVAGESIELTLQACRPIYAQAATPAYCFAVLCLQAALEYTDSQQQDALHLRRMFCGKLGQLARDRASIMSQMSGACQLSHPQPVTLDFKHTAARIAETKDYAAKLCANRAEERQAFIYCAVCFLCCVSLSSRHPMSWKPVYIKPCLRLVNPSNPAGSQHFGLLAPFKLYVCNVSPPILLCVDLKPATSA